MGLGIGFTGVIALVGIDVAGNGQEMLGALAIFVGAVGYAIGPMLIKLGMGGLDSARDGRQPVDRHGHPGAVRRP